MRAALQVQQIVSTRDYFWAPIKSRDNQHITF